MQSYELEIIFDNLGYSVKEDWERTRFQSYITAQTQSTKKLTPQDLIKFDWDNETSDKEGKVDTVSKEDKERLIQKMNKIIQDKNK